MRFPHTSNGWANSSRSGYPCLLADGRRIMDTQHALVVPGSHIGLRRVGLVSKTMAPLH
jgi:hypothetical protein